MEQRNLPENKEEYKHDVVKRFVYLWYDSIL